MARLRSHDPAGDAMVPAELRDPRHATWSDPVMFDAWCRAYGIAHVAQLNLETWADRFRWASDAWAITNMIVLPGTPAIPDRARLHDLGVPLVGALERARAQAER
ncbi:hypothetical protein [Nakamurella sp.]|uniref:hypothetical protein n=1 Tax=Nakamurella sp. TaxID=1869182 RepID=UPI0037839FDF